MKIDIATILGLTIAVIGILGGQALEGGHVGSIMQGTAALIVLGGTIGACLIQFPLGTVLDSLKAAKSAFFEEKVDHKETIGEIIRFANKARKEGLISLEAGIKTASDPFLKRALTMAVDGVEPRVLRETMEMEISNIEEEHEHSVKFWEAMGGYSPTIGIIGAVLGLIHVMENLSDPSKLGGGIAVAFVATVYGVSLANIVFLPISGKLKMRGKAHSISKEIMLVGVISILEGENPRLIEDKLKSFLSAKEREAQTDSKDGRQQRAA